MVKKKDSVKQTLFLTAAPKVSPPSAAAVVVPATEGGKLLVLGDDINWSRPSGVYIPPGGSRFGR